MAKQVSGVRDEGALLVGSSAHLLLAGRLRPPDNGRPLECPAERSEQPPNGRPIAIRA